MRDPPLDEEELRRWRDEADAALRSAHLQADDGLHNWSCFSSEPSSPRRTSVVSPRAAVVGSVARGDFNVRSDVDIVVVAETLPNRTPDRGSLLIADAPAGVQPVGFTPEEFELAWTKGNALVREAVEHGVVLEGEAFFRKFRSRGAPPQNGMIAAFIPTEGGLHGPENRHPA